MQFDDFVAKYNGQPVEVEDPSNLDQCFDLAFAWCDFIGVDRATIRHLNAYQIWTQPLDLTLQFFDYIPNTPNGVPKKGDIVVFNQNVGSAGHVSIASGVGDANGFQSFDQNWAGAQYAKFVNHTYTSVYGWLHRKETITDPVILAQSDAFIAVATKLNTAANKEVVLGEIDKLIGYEDTVVQKDKTIQELQSELQKVKEDLTAKTLEDEKAQQYLNKAQADINELQKKYTDSQTANDDLSSRITELEKAIVAPVRKGWKKTLVDLIDKI